MPRYRRAASPSSPLPTQSAPAWASLRAPPRTTFVAGQPPGLPPLQPEAQRPRGQCHKTLHLDGGAASPRVRLRKGAGERPSRPAAGAAQSRLPTSRVHSARGKLVPFVARFPASLPAPSQYSQKGPEQDLQITAKTPCPDIFPVQLHSPLERWITPGRDLPQPGNPRRHIQAREMFNFVGRHVVHRMRSRTHEAHRAIQNIPKLRKFIDAVPSQKTPYPCDSR